MSSKIDGTKTQLWQSEISKVLPDWLEHLFWTLMKKTLLNYCRECAFSKSTILDLVLSCQPEEHQILNCCMIYGLYNNYPIISWSRIWVARNNYLRRYHHICTEPWNPTDVDLKPIPLNHHNECMGLNSDLLIKLSPSKAWVLKLNATSRNPAIAPDVIACTQTETSYFFGFRV